MNLNFLHFSKYLFYTAVIYVKRLTDMWNMAHDILSPEVYDLTFVFWLDEKESHSNQHHQIATLVESQ